MTLESLETTRTMIFVAIFSAEKDEGIKEVTREIIMKKNSVNFSLAPFISPLTPTLSPKGRGEYRLL
jgi:hypothetical protein